MLGDEGSDVWVEGNQLLSFQERLEASPAGRWLLRTFLAVTVGFIVISNFPGSGLKSMALPSWSAMSTQQG